MANEFRDFEPPSWARPQTPGGAPPQSSTPPPFGRRGTPTADSNAQSVTIGWSGDPWSLVKLGFINLGLNIVTLGIYGFWGRTEVRKRVWSMVRINNEPLAYTGTGGEMFKGFLIVLGVVILPLLLIQIGAIIAFGPKSPVGPLFQFLSYIVFFYLIGVAAWRARRYRLSRTTWRGIRGTMEGSSWGFGATSFFTSFLTGITAGWSSPWRANHLQTRLTEDTRLGDRPLRYDGTTQGLYGPFAALWFGTIILYFLLIGIFVAIAALSQKAGVPAPRGAPKMPDFSIGAILAGIVGFMVIGFVFSIISGYYRSRLYNHFAKSTSFEGARFGLTTTTGSLIWLFISNYLMSVFTLGILKPVAEARAMRYYAERLTLNGPVDLEAVAQSQAALDRTGEGLATMFDVDVV